MKMVGREFISHEISRTNRNLFLANLAILLIIVCAGYFNQRYFYNFFFGPFLVNEDFFLSIRLADNPQKYFLTVRSDKAVASGYKELEVSDAGSKEKADLLVLPVGEKLLLVKTPLNAQGDTFTGYLDEIPFEGQDSYKSHHDSRTTITRRLEESHKEIEGAFYPFMLNAIGFRKEGYVYLGIGIPLFLLGLHNIKKCLMRMKDSSKHPIVKTLQRYGQPEVVVSNIESELARSSLKYGSCIITDSWLLFSSFFETAIASYSDIVWAYEKTEEPKGNWLGKLNRKYYMVLNMKPQRTIEISLSERKLKEFAPMLCAKTPSAVHGYSEELENFWIKSPNQFISEFEKRKRDASA